MSDDKLCRNCKHFTWPKGSIPICSHPSAVLSTDPVLGGKKYLYCAVMRGEGADKCGPEGRFHEELAGLAERQRRGVLLDERNTG